MMMNRDTDDVTRFLAETIKTLSRRMEVMHQHQKALQGIIKWVRIERILLLYAAAICLYVMFLGGLNVPNTIMLGGVVGFLVMKFTGYSKERHMLQETYDLNWLEAQNTTRCIRDIAIKQGIVLENETTGTSKE